MKSHKKKIKKKDIRTIKRGSAIQAIGTLEKNIDLFILTYGQFSLIDGLMAILRQTGPAHVAISTWTASYTHLDQVASLLATSEMLSIKLIVADSFKTRKPEWHRYMYTLFGSKTIREINTHAKFIIIRNEKWDICITTSMNLNGNPRLENIEITDNKELAEFFQLIIDDTFDEIPEMENTCVLPKLENVPESVQFKLVSGDYMNVNNLKEARYSHEISEH